MNAVELRGVDVVRGERRVLAGVTLTIGARERVALRGPNGIGKSTLLDVLLGLQPVRCGSVRVCGQPPPTAAVGYVPQNVTASFLPWLCVERNVTLPLTLRRAPSARIQAELARVRERIDPQGAIDLRARPTTLSPGQLQLAALMRALIARPKLLLCDEPSSALDEPSTRRAQRVLMDVVSEADGPALVLVTHDALEARRLAARHILLEGQPARLRDEPDTEAARRERHSVCEPRRQVP